MVDWHDDRLLADLGNHPGWPALRAVGRARMEREFERLAKTIMSGQEVTPEQIAYKRGFYAGIKAILDNPTLEAKRLERSMAEIDKNEVKGGA